MSDTVQVEVRRSGRRFEAEALLELAADPRIVWETITDYPALPRFMPGIRACRVVERHPAAAGRERLIVEQEGEFRFLLFAQAMKVRLEIDHEPLRWSEARAVSFDLGLLRRRAIEIFEGRYELGGDGRRRGAARTRLRYTALIGLLLPPPPAVGSLSVKHNLAAQLQAVVAEVARRQHAGAA